MYELQQNIPLGQAYNTGIVPPHLLPQGFLSGLLGRRYADSYGCGPTGSLGQRQPALLPFGADPALALQSQLAPQSFLSGILGQPFQYTTGCGPNGSLGGRLPTLLPFGVDPVALAYAQQAQQAQLAQAMQGQALF